MADKVGFSLGWFFDTGPSMSKILDFYKYVGATAIEFCFSVERLKNFVFYLNDEFVRKISQFNYVSLHAPDFGYDLEDNETKEILEMLTHLTKSFSVSAVVVHPDVVKNFSVLENSGLPFLIENMDAAKSKGLRLSDFERWNEELSLGHVLDLQHVFENDPTMGLAKKFIKLMGLRLGHMHVSGQTASSNHSLVYLSENREAIEKILKIAPQVPIILEGELTELNVEVASRELEFIRSCKKS